MAQQPVALTGAYLFARDLAATAAFYRLLGFTIREGGPSFAAAETSDGIGLSFGTAELTRSDDPSWREPVGPTTNTLNFTLASREAVDAKYEETVAVGYAGDLAPIDAPWGARFAIIDDLDGNVIGLHSPT